MGGKNYNILRDLNENGPFLRDLYKFGNFLADLFGYFLRLHFKNYRILGDLGDLVTLDEFERVRMFK